MTAEATISKSIIRWICESQNGHAIKLHSAAAQGAGEPDILGCIAGRMIAIETKRPGEKLRPLQVWALRRWQDAGAVAISATSLADAREQIENTIYANDIKERFYECD